MVAIVGPSGSGKSTIINMITGIDRPIAGAVTIGGDRIDQLSEEQLASWRGENVGIVFQFFHNADRVGERGAAARFLASRF